MTGGSAVDLLCKPMVYTVEPGDRRRECRDVRECGQRVFDNTPGRVNKKRLII